MRFLCAIANGLGKMRDLPPLFFRLLIAFVFWTPAMIHLKNVAGFGQFLAQLDMPYPEFMAYVVMTFEVLALILMPLGLATRIEAFFLMCIMVMAIATVHWHNGWSSENNGLEKPLYYLLILFSLFVTGPGCISLDGLFARGARKPK